MIPTVNLDDRTFDDIKDEAIRLIPRYCPEWTNHNASDPGITLIELFSWMTEMTLYRLNKVPSKTYLAMLELMGLSLTAPQSSRTIINFFPVAGTKKDILIKKGTKVASVTADTQPIIFETEQNLYVKNSNLISCINRNKEKYNEFCTSPNTISSFPLFESENSIEHYLYVSSPIFNYLTEGHGIQITFEPISEILSVNDEIINHVFWEYWDGRTWSELPALPSLPGFKKNDDVIYLKGPIDLQPCDINGTKGLFLRAILTDIPENKNTFKIKSLKVRSIFEGEGFIPDQCIANSNSTYTDIDMNNSFRLVSETPSYNEIFYIAADEIFKNKKVKVSLSFNFSEVYVQESSNENAEFAFEYWNGKDWIRLSKAKNEFQDGTFNFKKSGTVSFKVPNDISEVLVNNVEHLWIRIRLVTKDFSIGGNYVQDEKGTWNWEFTTKVQSPLLSKIRITYNAPQQLPENVIVNSNFKWKKLNKLCSENKNDEEITMFDINNEHLPSLYLGFSDKISKGKYSLYFKMNESQKIKKSRVQDSSFLSLLKENDDDNNNKGFINIDWEYWDGNKWSLLEINDFTQNFTESGFIDFNIPEDFSSLHLYSKDLFWIRAVKTNGSFEKLPVIDSIITNAIYASNENTYTNEIIGSGTGAPGQIYNVAHPNLLPGISLVVNEGSIPTNNELEKMKNEGIDEPFTQENDEVWVKYKEVQNFYNSDAFSRHYTVDYSTGKISFGDGIHGITPPKGKFNIKIEEYKVGGGESGNVAAHKLQFLTQSIPYIAGCDNPFASEGGCNMESIDSLKSRAAGVFKSLNRAVTSEDFQWIAKEASSSVGRAHCLKNKNKKGEICTIIVPELSSGMSYDTKLVPSRELIRRVRKYLEDRKLVGTAITVQGPVYRDFEITLSLEFKSNVYNIEAEKQKIKELLLVHFHSLLGDNGQGWEFGKSVTKGAILKQLEKTDSILSVNQTEIKDIDANISVDKFILKDDELPYLSSVTIIDQRN